MVKTKTHLGIFTGPQFQLKNHIGIQAEEENILQRGGKGRGRDQAGIDVSSAISVRL